MYQLDRTVRFCVSPGVPVEDAPESHNTFAAAPAMVGLGAFYEVRIRCRGPLDPQSDLLINIKLIDQAVRSRVVPIIAGAWSGGQPPSGIDPSSLLVPMLQAVTQDLGDIVHELTWSLTPFYRLTIGSDHMTTKQAHIHLQFEFAASHRLHAAQMDQEANTALFGKCNRPNGHGHNYRLEVVVARQLQELSATPALPEIERIVHDKVIERFDHTHLNLDTEEFAHINPSVEHIARVCFELLADPIRAAGGELVETTVWETEKTSCTYSG